MTLLDRMQIDRLVRELEDGAFTCALARTPDTPSAERLLLQALTTVAPFFPRSATSEELQSRIEATIKRAIKQRIAKMPSNPPGGQTRVPNTLHVRLVDTVEEHQSDEPVGRKKAFVASIAGTLLVAALVIFGVIRWDALGAAQPVVAGTNPEVNGKEIPVQGDFWVRFTRAPSAKPAISIQPPDASLDAPLWDGHTVLVSYRGLHLASSYLLTIEADYQSRYGDHGQFIQRWRFTTEGYPVLAKLSPSDGATGIFRYGDFAIDFNHRPPVAPVLMLTPPDGNLQPGQWNGSTWLVPYGGLKPSTTYGATVIVDYGVPKANIKATWSFTTESGAPPTGVPVVWYSTTDPGIPPDTGVSLRMVAVDWTGRQVGTMYPGAGVEQSPDGSVLYRQDGTFVDEHGAPLGSVANGYAIVVADDNRSICEIVIRGSEPWLYAGALSGPIHPVAAFGQETGHFGVQIIACSVASNRAVLVENGPAGVSNVTVSQLTSDRTLYQRVYSPPSAILISSSQDGRYLAELSTTVDDQGRVLTATTQIRRVADGRVVARLDNQQVVAFSWDDTRVVVAPASSTSAANDVALIEWRTGTVLWRLAGPLASSFQPVLAIPRPNSSDMMVATATQTQPPNFDHLWLVHADGSADLVVSSGFYPAFFGGP